MANQWFRFKKFTIQQDRCAMKVGTDGVLLGAWTDLNRVIRALDIGTGTGLLALMLAQRSESIRLDAIEIDEQAAKQADENVANSLYASRIRIINQDFSTFHSSEGEGYDLLICNPPYFRDSLKSGDSKRTMARHADSLSLDSLFSKAATLMNSAGRLSIILPAEQLDDATHISTLYGLFPCRLLNVLPLPGREAKRVCIEFSFEEKDERIENLVIENGERHNYTEDYIELTKEFYLKF